jgi:hypothetical protein
VADLEQDYQAVLAALRDEKNQQISEYQAQAWAMAQRAYGAEQRAEALRARIDGALMPLKSVGRVAAYWAKYSGSADKSDLGCAVVKAIEVLKGEPR